MIKDEAEKPADISKILKLALDYNPSLAMRDISTPRMWISEGCDIELDIIPTISEIIKKPRRNIISTFSYFTNPVLAARDKRLIIKQQREAIPIEKIMQSRQQMIDKGYDWMLTDQQKKELEAYKQKSPTPKNEA